MHFLHGVPSALSDTHCKRGQVVRLGSTWKMFTSEPNVTAAQEVTDDEIRRDRELKLYVSVQHEMGLLIAGAISHLL